MQSETEVDDKIESEIQKKLDETSVKIKSIMKKN